MADADTALFARRVTAAVSITTLAAVAAVVIVLKPQTLLLAFGGALVAVLLDTMVQPVRRWTGLSHGWALTVVLAVLTLTAAGTLWFMGAQLSQEATKLKQTLPDSWRQVRGKLVGSSWGQWGLDQAQSVWDTVSDNPAVAGRGLASRAGGWFSAGAEGATDAGVILFVGLFVAATPGTYVDGTLSLIPRRHRPAVRETLGHCYTALTGWLLGQLLSMVFIGVVTAVGLWLLGVPLAMVLGVIAGVLNFVPNVGPILAGVPAGLLALTLGPAQFGWVVGLYLAVQVLQNNVLTPLVQRRAASLPPAVLLVGQVLAGTWAGLLGLTLAAPLIAAVIVVVKDLYVGRALGDPPPEQPE